MVGERGFEPPTPRSRTRFNPVWKSVEFRSFQLIDIESVARSLLKVVASR